MADTPTPTPAPFTEDALRSAARDGARMALQEVAGQAQQHQMQQQQYQQAQQAQRQAAGDPIYTGVVRPYVEPALRQVALEAQSARDAAVFYSTNPQAAKYTQWIERDFEAAKSAGMPVDRRTVFNHLVGANFDHFTREREEQLRHAAAAGTTVGPAGVGRSDAATTLDAATARTMDFDALEAAVKSRGF